MQLTLTAELETQDRTAEIESLLRSGVQSFLLPSPACDAPDVLAAAAISVAHRHHLDIPRDLTVVGFDDTPIASIVSPAITTARQPIAEIAQSTIRMLHAASLVAGTDERESSAAPRHTPLQTIPLAGSGVGSRP